jgi:hypothetical protein
VTGILLYNPLFVSDKDTMRSTEGRERITEARGVKAKIVNARKEGIKMWPR